MLARRLRRLGLALAVFAALPAAGAAAQSARSYYDGLTAAQRTQLQIALIWIHEYNGTLDGLIGPVSIAGIEEFQRRHGFSPDGILVGDELQALFADVDAEKKRVGLTQVRDAVTGAVFDLPAAMFSATETNASGTNYYSPDGGVNLFTYYAAGNARDFAAFYDTLRSDPNAVVSYASIGGSTFLIGGDYGANQFYAAYTSSGTDYSGFTIFYDRSLTEDIYPVILDMVSSFTPSPPPGNRIAPFTPPGAASAAAATPAPEGEPADAAPAGPVTKTGSGFVLTAEGAILTNAHVVDGCSSVTVGGLGTTTTIRRDAINDLALLRLAGATGLAPVTLAPAPPRLGDDIIVMGFPLAGILADNLNVTTGILSSLAGLGGDTRFIQITAPVQAGNSGGPLVDEAGEVVGVVSAKLDALFLLNAVGDVPEGVNFAIRLNAMEAFLESAGIVPTIGPAGSPALSVADVAQLVGPSVVAISCTTDQ